MMKPRAFRGKALPAAVLAVGLAAGEAAGSPVTIESWRFAKDPTCKLQAEPADFDDSAWEQVRVPHDWAISGPFDKDPKANGGSGKLPWKGVGWYRTRQFVAHGRFAGDRYAGSAYLTFDGVMASPQVWVNGVKAGGWDYGYVGFTLEVSHLLKPGENVIAVRADTLDHRSRWYPGAGIYRKVTFDEKPAEHIVPGSVFITTPKVSRDEATVHVACAWAQAGASNFTFTVRQPKLWDVDSPNLYTLELDGMTYRYGIRTFAFTADDGFHLNGRRVQLKGVDLHADLGLLGMAFDKSAMRRQLTLMKDMGANALRTSHNPHAPEVLDLCDEMGIVVWNEAFDKWDGTAGRRNDQNLEAYVTRNLQAFVKRDRNHPSVVCWSISNEIGKGNPSDPSNPGLTRERCRFFRDMVRLIDPTRPVGNGNISNMAARQILDEEIFADLDLTGWNYCASYRALKTKHPKMPLVYSESASALSSYGFYLPNLPTGTRDHDKESCQCTSYDGLGIDIPDVEFDRMETDRYCAGEFVWTGIDYLGEPHPFWTEARSSYFGMVDLTGVPKDRFYLYRSHWNRSSRTLHLLPHWNWAGREGKTVPVFVYTDADEAELFVNGKSQGRRKKGTNPVRDLQPNKALGAKVTVSSAEPQNPAARLLDGDGRTRWCASTGAYPAWACLAFPKPVTFKHVALQFEFDYKSYGYAIEASDDGTTWRNIFEKPVDSDKRAVFEQPATASFLRVVMKAAKFGLFASIREVRLDDSVVEPRSAYYDVCSKYRLQWFDTVYEPGEVKAVAIRDGKPAESVAMRTAGAPVKINLTSEPLLTGAADELLWTHVDVLDAKGVRNPLATDRMFFKLEGPGKIVGVGNGDPRGDEPFADTASHKLFFGKAVAVVRRTGTGLLRLTVTAKGLESASVVLPEPTEKGGLAIREVPNEAYRWFETRLKAEDGVELYTYGVLPTNGVKCPVVLIRTPYDGNSFSGAEVWSRHAKSNIARGYACVVQQCRGSSRSDGVRIPYVDERSDSLAALAFVRTLPCYNGEIYVQGGSYLSSVHWAYLDDCPPDVKGAMLDIQCANRYPVVMHNGFPKIGLHIGWYQGQYKSNVKGFVRNGQVSPAEIPFCDFTKRFFGTGTEGALPGLDDIILHPRPEDPFWQTPGGAGGEYRRAFTHSRIPILMRTGWFDIYADSLCDQWREASAGRRANCALLIDAFDHGGHRRGEATNATSVVNFPNGSRYDSERSFIALDWFDSIRGGKPPKNVKVGCVSWYNLWENAWHTGKEIPGGTATLALPIEGQAERGFRYDPRNPVRFPAGCGIGFGNISPMPKPNFREDVLTYRFGPIVKTVDVAGRMRVVLRVKSDCRDTSFYVRVSVKKAGTDVFYGLRESIKALTWDDGVYEPGTERTLRFELADIACRLGAGDVVRLDVSSSNAAMFAPHTNVEGLQAFVREPKVANNAVLAKGSELVLPIIEKKGN